MVVLQSGKKIPGFTFYYVARAVLEKSDAMKEYRIIYYGNGHFIIEVVSGEMISYRTEYLVKKAFDEFFKDKTEPLLEMAGSQCLLVKL